MSDPNKSIPLPHFDGKDENFELFWPKFQAYAKLKGFAETIRSTLDPELPTTEGVYDNDANKAKKQREAEMKNNLAIAAFTMAFDSVALMNRISDAKSSKYPDGLAHSVVTGLLKKHRPTDRLSKMEALADLDAVTMEENDDPENMFNEIATIKQVYKDSQMDDANYLNHVLKVVSEDYKQVIAVEMRAKGDALSLDDVQEAMSSLYRLKNNKATEKSGKKSGNDETESILMAQVRKAVQSGDESALTSVLRDLCYYCGKPGHKAYQCKTKKRDQGNGDKNSGGNGNTNKQKKKKFNGTCNNCGKQGHKIADCWELEENKSKRPRNWKGGKNQNNVEAGEIAAECVLCAIKESCPMGQLCCQPCSKDVVTTKNERNDAEVSDQHHTQTNDIDEEAKDTGDSNLVVPNNMQHAELENAVADKRIEFLSQDNTDPSLTVAMNEEKVVQVEVDEEIDGGKEDEVKMSQVHLADGTIIVVPRSQIEVGHETDTALMAGELSLQDLIKHDELWVGDSGASSHLTFNGQGMTKARKGGINEQIVMGNGTKASSTQIGNIHGEILSKEGTSLGRITLEQVTYSPVASFNLLSLTALLKKGWTMEATSKEFRMKHNNKEIKLDIIIHTPKGMLFCMRIKRDLSEAGLFQSVMRGKKISINKLHGLFGHGGEERDRKMAKHLEITLTRGTLKPCAACAAAKAKMKALPPGGDGLGEKEEQDSAKVRIYVDLSQVKVPLELKHIVKHNSKPYWRLAVDEMTGLAFSSFHESKNKMVEPMCELLQKWKSVGRPVEKIRCDNAGENKLLEAKLKSAAWKLNEIGFEYTAANTPQQNAVVEKKFDTLYCRGRAMMICANVPLAKRYVLYREALDTATKLDGLTVLKIGNKEATRYEHWGVENPKFTKHMRVWGESGVVKVKKVGTPKLANRGVNCMFVGYASEHAGDCYRMYNEDTQRVHVTRDVRWLNRMYYGPNGRLSEDLSTLDDDDPDDFDDDSQNGDEDDKSNNNQGTVQVVPVGATTGHGTVITPGGVRRSTRVTAAPARLIEESGILMTEAEKQYHLAMVMMDENENNEEKLPFHITPYNIIQEAALVGAASISGFSNTAELRPMKYDEAMKTPDREGWKRAVKEEWERFKKYNVFMPVKRNDVPDNAKFVSTTWAMKKKSNGTLRARLNMRGYEQQEGIHYDEQAIASPVTTDVTVRVCMVLMLMAGWTAKLVDIKGAFLHGEFDNNEKIYTEVPQGFEEFCDPIAFVLLLMKTCYGLKQAAMMFWRELLKAMNHMKCNRSDCDPCLYWKHTDNGMIIWLSWVDDCLCIGNDNDVKEAKADIMKLFDCDDIDEFKEYVGCMIEHDMEKRSLVMTQPVMLQSFEDEFDLPAYDYASPAEPGKVLEEVHEGQELNPNEQSNFRKGVGKLLHMMRWTRPEIWNSVREVSRRMGLANQDHYKALMRIMKYCRTTRTRGWKLHPKRKWNCKDKSFEFVLRGKSDSNYASCKETRRSVTGFVVYLEDTLISVKSGMQKIIALSVSEAELFALVQCVQEIMFVKKLLESMKLRVKLPIIIEVDNKATVDLVNGWNISGGTKHSEVKVMYLRELKEEGIIRVYWHPTSDNEADIFTKNVDNKTFEKHVRAIYGE